jgi:hypothetical protein
MAVKLDPYSMMNGSTVSNKENNTRRETDSFYEGVQSKTPFCLDSENSSLLFRRSTSFI